MYWIHVYCMAAAVLALFNIPCLVPFILDVTFCRQCIFGVLARIRRVCGQYLVEVYIIVSLCVIKAI